MTAGEDYRELLRELHRTKTWGSSSTVPEMAHWCIDKFKVESLPDFGCGKGNVTGKLRETYPGITVLGYDPMDETTSLPDQIDMVFSKDVLEHAEPQMLEFVLSDLWQHTCKVQCHLIACHKAIHYLADGRNARLIIETPDWWQRLLRSMGFRILAEDVVGEIEHPRGRESIAATKYQYMITMG